MESNWASFSSKSGLLIRAIYSGSEESLYYLNSIARLREFGAVS